MHRVARHRLMFKVGLSLLSVAASLAIAGRADAAGVLTWLGNTNLWTTGSNWDPTGTAPDATEEVVLTSPAPINTIISMGTGGVAAKLTVYDTYGITGGPLTLTGNGELFVLGSGTGRSLTITAGGSLSGTTGSVGLGPTDSGNQLVVDGTGGGATLTTTSVLNIGYEATGNQLTVLNGGSATLQSLWVGGLATSASNSVAVAGAGSRLSTTQLILGYGGTQNDMTVSGGAGLTTASAYLGFDATASGNSLAITGAGTTWQSTGPVQVGVSGSGNTLSVTNAQATLTGTANNVVLGVSAGANGNQLQVSGSTAVFTTQAAIVVGDSGASNSFVVNNGAAVTSRLGRIGNGVGADGNAATVSGVGSSWTVNGTVRVGDRADNNSLTIENGGVVSVTGFGNNLWVGYGDGGDNNVVTVTGAGSKLDFTGTAQELVISGTNGVNNRVVIAESGTVAVGSVQLGPGGVLQIGDPANARPGAGFLRAAATINGNSGTSAFGGFVRFEQADPTYTFANRMTGPLQVVQSGSGKTVLTGSSSYTGKTSVLSGTLALSGTASIASSGTISVAADAVYDVAAVAGLYEFVSGQLLEGDGTVVSGSARLASGATIAPGTGSGIGTLSFDTAAFTLHGTLAINVSGTATDLADFTPGTSSLLTLDGASVLHFSVGDPLTAAAYVFAKYDALVGTFASVSGLPTGYTLDYNYLGGSQMALVAVPEPTALALLGVSGVVLLARRIRRRAAAFRIDKE
jgi:T5SS/PEP-CTERM-associated repeat protein